MNIEQVGLYAICLNHCWLNGSLPSDPLEIARAMKVPKPQFLRAWPRVKTCFTDRGDGRWVNVRQEAERALAYSKSVKNRASAVMGQAKRKAANAEDNLSERSANAQRQESAQQHASDSDSGVLVGFDFQRNPEIPLSPVLEIAPVLEEIEILYQAAGRPIPPKHRQLAAQYLVSIAPEKWPRIPAYVRWALGAIWADASKTKGFLNLLRDGDWDVDITARTIPAPVSAGAETRQQRILRTIEEA